MKKINIYIIILSILLGISIADASFAWPFKKKVQDLQVTDDKAFSTEENIFEGKESQQYNVFNNNSSSLSEQLQEATVEKTAMSEDEDTFSKNMDLISDTVDVYTQTGQYVAKGNAVLVVPNEQLQMYANEIIVDNNNYEITGIGNVRIVKDGVEHYGDYIRLTTKRESSFFQNPIIFYDELTISSKNATMHSNETLAKDGSVLTKSKAQTIFASNQYAAIIPSKLFDIEKTFDSNKNTYKIKAKKIIVKRSDDRNDITLKQATIYNGKYKVGYTPYVKIANDKDVSYVETIFPEIGNHTNVGMYIAPSILLPMPKASTLKLGPLLALNNSDFGLGAFARLSTPKSSSQLLYSSAKNKFVIGGEYRLTDNLKIRGAWNDYIDGGWMGGLLPSYGAELVFDKSTALKEANAHIRNFLSAGLYKDNEDYAFNPHTTMRYKWQMQVTNAEPIVGWERYLMLGYIYGHDFSLYQTGDTAGVVRVGPRLYTDLGRLFLELTYFVAGQYGESPFYFDRYRYGHGSVQLRGQYYINKYLSVGYYGLYNVTEPDWEGRRLTENQLVISAGTENAKIRFGWDTIRANCTIGLDVLLGSNKTYMEFDEMQINELEPKANKKEVKAERKAKKKKTRL